MEELDMFGKTEEEGNGKRKEEDGAGKQPEAAAGIGGMKHRNPSGRTFWNRYLQVQNSIIIN
jgi:hypothetical protein